MNHLGGNNANSAAPESQARPAAEDSSKMYVDLGPAVSSNELNDKYKDLLAKINRHARPDDANGHEREEGEDGIDEAGRPIADD